MAAHRLAFGFLKKELAKNPNGKFDGQHEIGDLLVLSNFTNGGGTVQLRVYRWVGSGGTDGTLDLIATTFDGFVNQSYQNAPNYPNWTYQGENVPNVGVPPPNVYATGSFIEGFIDLGQFNLDPCFSGFLLETRNAPAVKAALQDFAGGQFNVVPLPPTVVDGSRCGPGLLTLSASCNNGSGVRWYSSLTSTTPLTAADGVSPDGNSLTVNATQDVTYYVSCVRNGVPCESTRVPVTGTVYSLPVVVLAGGPMLCHDQPVTLTATVTNSSGNITYSWFKDGAPITGSTNQISVNESGNYQVKVKDDHQCPADSNTLTLSNPSRVEVTLAGGPIQCHDDFVTLTATASGGTGPYSYAWFKDGAPITGSTNQISVNESGNYQVKVKDDHQCPADSNTLTLSNPSQVEVTLAGGPIQCHDACVTLTATASGGTGPYSYAWFKDGAPITGSTNQISVNESGNYQVKVKDDHQCPADSNTLTLSNPSQVEVTLAGGPIQCHDAYVTLTATASGGTGPYSYAWFKDGAPITGSTNQISVNESGNYQVKVKDDHQCPADSNTLTLSNPSQVEVTLAGGPIQCHDAYVTLTATASGGTGPYSYAWFKDGAPITGSTNQISVNESGNYQVKLRMTISVLRTPTRLLCQILPRLRLHWRAARFSATMLMSRLPQRQAAEWGPYSYAWFKDGAPITGSTNQISVNESGNYQVKVKDDHQCPADSNTITLVNPSQINVTIEGGPFACSGQPVTLSATATGGTGAYNYQWYGNGILIPNQNASQLIVTETGAYYVVVTDANTCPATSNTINLTAPDPIVLSVQADPVTCVGGTTTVTLFINGTEATGNPPYEITWYDSVNNVVGTGNPISLGVGNYTVTVTQNGTCPVSLPFTINLVTCQGTTVTQGGWGAPANGNNWGKYRDDHFSEVFKSPTFLRIGDGNRMFIFDNAAAIKAFLKQGGNSAILPVGPRTNPANNKNTLANNVVALTLNVGFDAANPNFAPHTDTPLGNMILTSGPMMGYSVNDVLVLANKVLGATSTQFTPNAMNNIVDQINNNFDNGTTNQGYLACPCPGDGFTKAPVAPQQPKVEKSIVSQQETKVLLYPNPTSGIINLKFDADLDSAVSAQLFDASGKMVADFSKIAQRSGRSVSIEYQNYNLPQGMYIIKVKTSNFEKSFKIIKK